ncbi:hypothetical protein Hypma_005016 [Hypsizygus marmoreus]|uniref:Uncharacterized protein n=1 Tax=Hypsizygus marmoreus TaxID=39966 RepID=A0A369K843_HYPMA|nr:hypothetical protein Hypma_005016 [Hypsizygus marmoreus]
MFWSSDISVRQLAIGFMRLPLIPWSTISDYLFSRRGHAASQQNSATPLQPPVPISNIPVELLGEIFTACLQDANPLFYYGPERPPVANSPSCFFDPMTLGLVCRHWRAVALSMPTLWSLMCIRSPCRGHIQLTRVWLERSANCPLHLFLLQDSFHPSASDAEHVITDELVTLLMTQIHRWRRIDFRFTKEAPSSLFTISHGLLSQLETASLYVYKNDDDFSDSDSESSSLDSVWRVIHATPTLRQIRWDSDYLTTMPSHIPWRQLTNIWLNAHFPTSVIFDVLRSCQSVVDLDIDIEENSSTPSTPPVTLPHLRHLSIFSRCLLNPIFDQLTLPQISSLSLTRCHEAVTAEELSSINDLLTRSNRYLLKLDFDDGQREAPSDIVLAMLRLPRLSRLNDLYISSHIGDEVVHALTCHPQQSQDHFLPMLEYLIIGNCHGTTPGVLGTWHHHGLSRMTSW